MSNIPKEIEDKFAAYTGLIVEWERAETPARRHEIAAKFPPAYEEIKTAIAEAIQRGPLEHAEKPSSASDLIDALKRGAMDLCQPVDTINRAVAYNAARAQLEQYISALNAALKTSRDERARLEKLSAEKDEEIFNLRNARAEDKREIDKLAPFSARYHGAQERIIKLEQELNNERARIADKETALQASYDLHEKTARALEEARGERDAYKRGAERVDKETAAELAEARAEIARLEEIVKSADASTPADDCADALSRMETLKAKEPALLLGMEWLSLVEQDYLKPEGIAKGAARLRETLRHIWNVIP